MAFMKHPELGNKYFPDSEVEKLTAQGWVKWPRTREQKSRITFEKTQEFITAVVADAINIPPVKRKYTRKAP